MEAAIMECCCWVPCDAEECLKAFRTRETRLFVIAAQKMSYGLNVSKVVYVPRGFCTHVPCRFTVPEWYKYSSEPFYLYWFKITKTNYYLFWANLWVIGDLMTTNDRRQKAKVSHLKLTGNPDKGDCSFSIIYAGPQDAGRYYLRIDKGEGRYRHDFISSKHKSYSEVQVIITDLKKPNIEKPSNVIRGQPVTLSCVVPDTCSWKPPEITWPKEEKPSATSRWSRQHSQWSWSHGVNMTFIPSLAEENASLTCHVRFPATRKTIQDTVHLTFAYSSSAIENKVASTCRHVRESLVCRCSSHAWPPPQIYWEVNGKNVTENSTSGNLQFSSWTKKGVVVSLLKWRRSPKKHIVNCKIRDSFGQSTVILSNPNVTEFPLKFSSGVILGIVISLLAVLAIVGAAICFIVSHRSVRSVRRSVRSDSEPNVDVSPST